MTDIKQEQTDRRIVELRSRGCTPHQIGREVGLTRQQVTARIRVLALEIRSATRDLVATRFLEHDQILMTLRAKCQKAINEMKEWDSTRVIAMLKVLERQAKLLGLDVDPRSAADNDSWLDNKAPAELVEMARRFNLTLPPDLQVP